MSQQQNQGYIHIEEDIVADPSTRIIQLRNVAYSRPLSDTSRPTNRIQLLDSLMPLTRNPSSSVPTLIDEGVQRSSRSTPRPASITSFSTTSTTSYSSSSPSPPPKKN